MGSMRTVQFIALSSAVVVVVSGCRKEPDSAATRPQFVAAAIVQCLDPDQPDRWSSQALKWTSSVSQKHVLQIAAQEMSAKNICRSRTGANWNDGLCWWVGWVGDPRPQPCTAGPPLS